MSSTTNIRIAMTAHSLIYAPLYRACQIVNESDRDISVELVFSSRNDNTPRGFGDQGAYDQLRRGSDIDLCVADPMVVAAESWNYMEGKRWQKSVGKIAAVLVCRPALWAMTTPHTTPQLRAQLKPGKPTTPSSVANRLEKAAGLRIAVNLGRVCTYGPGSTAYRVMEFMEANKHFTWSMPHAQVEQIGDEFSYLEEGATNPVDVIVTCDCFSSYYLGETRREDAHQFFAWHLSSLVDDIPFTALICKRDISQYTRAQRAGIRLLLAEMQHVLEKEVPSIGYSEEIVDSFLAAGSPALHPAVSRQVATSPVSDSRQTGNGAEEKRVPGDTANLGGSTWVPKDFAERLLTKLRTAAGRDASVSTLFPKSVRPDASWVFRAWSYSFLEIWRITNGRDVTRHRVRRCFKSCVEKRFGRRAAPRGLGQRLISFIVGLLDELTIAGDESPRVVMTFIFFIACVVVIVLADFFPEQRSLQLASRFTSTPFLLGLLLLNDFVRAGRRRWRRQQRAGK